MQKLKIFRYLPGQDPYWKDYEVEAGPDDMVLTLLNRIRETIDSTLAYRFSCRSAVCGSCAMLINGKPRLACQTRLREVAGEVVTLAPLTGMKVIKDLIVDMEPYWNNLKRAMPWLEEAPDSKDAVITSKTTDLQESICACILCASCYAACPETGAQRSYLGPHAIMEGYRILHDPRDTAAKKRLDVLAGPDGAWHCDGAFGCIGACPWDVSPVKYLAKVRTESMAVRFGKVKLEELCKEGGDK